MSHISFLGNTITSEGITHEENKKVSRQSRNTTNSETSQKTHRFHTIFLKFHTQVKQKSATLLQIVAKAN